MGVPSLRLVFGRTMDHKCDFPVEARGDGWVSFCDAGQRMILMEWSSPKTRLFLAVAGFAWGGRNR